MFEKVKLKTYLLAVFSAIIVLGGILTAVSVFGMGKIESSTNKLLDNIIAADTAIKDCRIHVNVAARDLREMMLAEDRASEENLKSEINASLAAARERIAQFKSVHGERDGLAAEYEAAFNQWVDIANRAVSEIEKGNKEQAKQIILNECSPVLSSLSSIAQRVDAATTLARSESEKASLQEITIFRWLCIFTFLIVLVGSLFLAVVTTRKITGIVNKVEEAVIGLSKGDLKSTIDYQADNEFGSLVERMNFSFKELLKYVETIDYVMGEYAKGNFACATDVEFLGDFKNIKISVRNFRSKISDVLSELHAASEQVNVGAGQVASGAQALAQGATEQAGSVEDLSDRINEISEQISKSAEYAQNANVVGHKASEVVNRSRDEMKQMLGAIKDIAVASEDIQKIIKVIDDIAFQTNILALNAAVEAARAGNAGKGFAVVADEVRNLAQKSADAAKNTTELIGRSLQHVKNGEELAANTDAAFDEMANQTTQILDMVEKIADSSRQQADAIANISQGVKQISSVVQMNSATSEESAAASEELSGQANVMKSLLNQFRISEDAGNKSELYTAEKRRETREDMSKY